VVCLGLALLREDKHEGMHHGVGPVAEKSPGGVGTEQGDSPPGDDGSVALVTDATTSRPLGVTTQGDISALPGDGLESLIDLNDVVRSLPYDKTISDIEDAIARGQYADAVQAILAYKALAKTNAHVNWLDRLYTLTTYKRLLAEIQPEIGELRNKLADLTREEDKIALLRDGIRMDVDDKVSMACSYLLRESATQEAFEALLDKRAQLIDYGANREPRIPYLQNSLAQFMDGLFHEDETYVAALCERFQKKQDFGAKNGYSKDIVNVVLLSRTRSPKAQEVLGGIAFDKKGTRFKRTYALLGLAWMHNESSTRAIGEFLRKGMAEGESEEVLAAGAVALQRSYDRAVLDISQELVPLAKPGSYLRKRLMVAFMDCVHAHDGDLDAGQKKALNEFYRAYRSDLMARVNGASPLRPPWE